MAQAAEQIRHDIEETRTRMGETIDALRDKADVGARAQASATHAKAVAGETVKIVLGDARSEVKHLADTGMHMAAGADRRDAVLGLSVALGVAGAASYLFGSRK